MLNFRPILLVVGALLSVLSVTMLIPAIIDLLQADEGWVGFLVSSFLTAFVGVSLVLTNRGNAANINLRQAFVLTAASWISLVAFAAIPFCFSNLNLGYTDAFFESMSGLTTTGATVLVGLDDMSPGILIWRSLLQWMGGIGIIVLALAILPMLKIGGMQLFRTESSDKSDKILPRTAQISGAIGSIYLLLTIFCAALLWNAGMSEFDALNHAMTTIATGGFSTHDKSILYFDNVKVEYIMSVFMVISSIPFVLYIKLLQGNVVAIWQDSQVRWFICLLVLSIIAVAIFLVAHHEQDTNTAIRYSVFNIVSVVTTSGFSSYDYSSWGGFAVTLIFLLSVMGGCTGSTTGGIKIFRYQVLYQTAKMQITHLIQPHAILRPRFNNKPISDVITNSVLSYIILFSFSFLVLAVFLSMCGLDYISSMSAAASALSNLGPGLGEHIGPSGNFATVPDIAKWALAFAMLIGRLEIFTILVLFSVHFWRD